MGWATFRFRDVVQRVPGGRNPCSDRDVAYPVRTTMRRWIGALFNAPQSWINSGQPLSPAAIETDCAWQSQQDTGGCHFDPAYQPKPLFSRVSPR